MTIENDRKAAGRVDKRDDSKLYNPKNPKKDELKEIMDMLKEIKVKQGRNERPPFNRNDRVRLHDMPYNTNWKDGKPERPTHAKDTPDPLKKVNIVDDDPWCDVCRLPHDPNHCIVAQAIFEKGNQESEEQPMVNAISSEPIWGGDEDDSSDEDQNDDYYYRGSNQQRCIQQIFSDEEDNPTLRRLTPEERRAYTIAAVEHAKHTYQRRNKDNNTDLGTPAGIFVRNQQHIEASKKPENQAQTKQKEGNQTYRMTKQPIVQTHGKKISSCHSFMSHALSQLKITVPLMDMMKFADYRHETVKILSNVQDFNNKDDDKSNEETPIVYLGTTLNKRANQVDPFYLTLLINNKLVKNCMIDSGAAVNIMSADVMKEVGLKVDTPYGKCYAMDNRSVPVVGIIKNIEFRFPSFPHISYRTDITVVEISASYGMLLSRQWSNLVGGHVQLDMSYATIPVGGKEIRIEREPQSYYLVEDYILDPEVNFCHSDMDNFQVSITKPTSKIVDPISIYVKENCNDIWQMFFDGACSKEGNGAGIIFVSPSGKTFKFSFLLNFECTNNIAEYEALVIGLGIAKAYRIKMLAVLGDSDLIVSQIRHKFSTRNPRLK